MSFNFNPSLWFVCRLCQRSFASTESLKEHKLACHLGECMGVKCIVFEERLLHEEWMPEANFCENQNGILNRKHDNKNASKHCKNVVHPACDSANGAQFKNPYVSLTRLSDHEIKLALNKNSSSNNCQQKYPRRRKQLLQKSCYSKIVADKESELSKQKLQGTDRYDKNNGYKIKYEDLNCNDIDPFNSYGDIHSEEETLITNLSPIYVSSTPANSEVNEAAHFNLDPEFIVGSVPQNSDPDSDFILPQQSLTISNAEHNPNFIITDSDQQMIFINEASDLNSNIQIVELKMLTYDSDLVVQNQTQEPETGGSYPQDQQSASLVNSQSRAALDGPAGKPFMCEICFTSFRTKNKVKQHMLSHSTIKPFKCSKCPSRFKRNQELTKHQIVHGKESNFKCRFCSKYFGDNRSLLVHERTHTGDKPYKCSVAQCGYAAISNTLLTAHIRSKHSEELGLQQFICPTCGKIYGLRRSLDLHIQLHHSDITPFHCTHHGCPLKFKLKYSLRRHLKTHK